MPKEKKEEKSYDSPYKQMFSNKVIFKQFLEGFVKKEFVKEIDFDNYDKVDKSFISKEYSKTESDLLYKIKLKNTENEAYIYILLEFQSTVDKFMSVRCLNYITNFYIDLIKSSKKTLKILPPVFPIVLYNGDTNWTASENTQDVIENNHLLGKYGINFKYFKVIEKDYSKNFLLKLNNIVSNLFLFDTKLKKLDEKLLEDQLIKLFEKEEDKTAVSLIINYFRYILIDDKMNEGKYDLLEKVYFKTREVKTMFSTAVKKKYEKVEAIAIEKGMAKGMAKGIEKGIEKGKNERELEMAINMIKKGFDDNIVNEITGLSIEKIQELRNKNK